MIKLTKFKYEEKMEEMIKRAEEFIEQAERSEQC